MRSEENPLDLNNLPEDYIKDGKQVLEDTSSCAAGHRKKKSGARDGKEECGKVYECRFCSLKFCKSQALGGHMNRHRQERETETLNRARQLVFNSDSLLGQGPHTHHHHHHLGGQPIPHGGYHHQTGNLADPSMQFRSVYPTRLFSGSSTATLLPSPQSQPYMYSSPTRLVPFPSSHYPATSNHDYFLGHVVPSNTTSVGQQAAENTSTPNNYTCIGAPVNIGPHGFSSISNYGSSDIGGGSGGEMATLYNHNHDHEGGLSWGRSCTAAGTTTQQQKQRFDPSSINRFQDGF